MTWQLVITKYILGVAGLIFANNVFAANLTLNFVDQYGAPLSNTVVEHVNANSVTTQDNLSILEMDQVDKQFSPVLLIAQQGQQVNFPNSDNIRHHVYSFSPTKPFQLKLYSGQPEKPITFDNEGIVVLGCNIHDSMVGYIYVSKNKHVYQSDEQGRIELKNVTLPVQLSAWNPLQKATLEEKKIISLAINTPNNIQLSLQTADPAPRNTFGNKFKGRND
ncbi:methylamine utilization protein [Pseudoalteromonas sp. NEC-BIFX-2020_002]|uniref:methylamine utilization protein n=1 Tax=Pseudoalteromonas sp. NEC-BIFX-2020_002 TaxID=2732353 RepID=UPI00147689F9|nr:methylamine utilization protein [Pseudoalteromonas sp. NEC-BIFX-2020_002]NNG44511.1 methylamine utilization protein [Pseudoalteromonas sp. NEC-BIFX-2020_002]